MEFEIAFAVAVLGTAGFLADVVLHVVNGRRIRDLEAEVRERADEAAERGARIEALVAAAEVRAAEAAERGARIEALVAKIDAEIAPRVSEHVKAAVLGQRGGIAKADRELERQATLQQNDLMLFEKFGAAWETFKTVFPNQAANLASQPIAQALALAPRLLGSVKDASRSSGASGGWR